MTIFASRSARRTVSIWCATIVVLAIASTASAQFRPRVVQNPTVGDRFTIEGGVDIWFPTAELTIASGGSGALSGLQGTDIDAKRDLGLVDKRLPQFNLVLKAAKRHRFRVQYVPIKYEQSAVLSRQIDFNGQRYSVGLPVNSTLNWRALRLGYEYDFVVKPRGFVGFIIEDKQTDVRMDVVTPLIAPQFAHAQAPIPALGAIARYWAAPHLAFTGEVTGFKIPDSVNDRYNAHYVDIDVYATLNATNNVGVKVGYRSLDLGYKFREDSGAFTLRGVYVGIVARY